MSFRADIAASLLCVFCHRVCIPHNRADLVCTRAARLFPTFPRWQRKVAEGFFRSAPSCWRPPALRQKNSFWPNWPPEPLAVTFPFSFHLSSDLSITVWTLKLFDYEALPYKFCFCSVLSSQTPSLFAAWFVFSSLLLQLLDCAESLINWLWLWSIGCLLFSIDFALYTLGHLVAVRVSSFPSGSLFVWLTSSFLTCWLLSFSDC